MSDNKFDNSDMYFARYVAPASFIFLFLLFISFRNRLCPPPILHVVVPAPPLDINVETTPLTWQYRQLHQINIDVKESINNKFERPNEI